MRASAAPEDRNRLPATTIVDVRGRLLCVCVSHPVKCQAPELKLFGLQQPQSGFSGMAWTTANAPTIGGEFVASVLCTRCGSWGGARGGDEGTTQALNYVADELRPRVVCSCLLVVSGTGVSKGDDGAGCYPSGEPPHPRGAVQGEEALYRTTVSGQCP